MRNGRTVTLDLPKITNKSAGEIYFLRGIPAVNQAGKPLQKRMQLFYHIKSIEASNGNLTD